VNQLLDFGLVFGLDRNTAKNIATIAIKVHNKHKVIMKYSLRTVLFNQ